MVFQAIHREEKLRRCPKQTIPQKPFKHLMLMPREYIDTLFEHAITNGLGSTLTLTLTYRQPFQIADI